MPLTHILLIVLTASAVIAVIFLVRLFIQLRRTAIEAEKTLAEVQVLTRHLSELDLEVKARVEELGGTIRASRDAVTGLSEATMMFSSKMMPVPAKFLPFVLPVARFVLRQLKNGRRNTMSNDKSSALEVAVSFVIGATAGFVLGVLFAPASGKETRQKIQEEVNKTGEKAKENFEKITKEAEKGIKVVREKTQEGLDAIREFIDKKKEEFLKRGPEGLPDENPKA
jgi:gas vesicle protein